MSCIEVQIKNQVATITLNRPEKHNAFNEEMIDLLSKSLTDLNGDSKVRVIVIKSSGKSFCAGADINWQSAMLDKSLEENKKDIGKFGNLCNQIFESPKVTIACINGACYGGGVGVVSACDIALAVEDAIFSLSEVRLGLVPGVISPYVMKKINPSAVYRYFLTAERFDSCEAKNIGLISESFFSNDQMEIRLQYFITEILQNSPEAIKYCKTMINKVYDSSFGDAVSFTPEFTAQRRLSVEGREGMQAFLEKRKPNWSI